ncbi:GntR family transcriptional regulator [Terrihabitans sp. B22-R8]|uniref:GntR family transcriptional regulator n=1 Tax=Terrihabitans sp. B22-R8 TaxID=3425128 RepID=UPI00403CF940
MDFIPLYARIERHLRDEIASGRLREGDRMPSEPELARSFNTTRATVSRALQQLVFEGVVLRRPGSGTFVAATSLSAPLETSRVHSFEEQLAAKGAEITYKLLNFDERAASAEERDDLHLDGESHIYALDRLRIVSGKNFSVECRVIPAELGRHITLDMLHSQSIHRILHEHFRLPVHRVEGKIRAGLASQAIASHLDVKAGSPVLIREYVLFSMDRRPLVCGESFYREDFSIDYLVQQSLDDEGSPHQASKP